MSNLKIQCKFPDGEIKAVTYGEIKKHNISTIEDNVVFGLCHPGEYTEEEVNNYYAEAMKNQKARMKIIRENPDTVMIWNTMHEMYELEEEQS